MQLSNSEAVDVNEKIFEVWTRVWLQIQTVAHIISFT